MFSYDLIKDWTNRSANPSSDCVIKNLKLYSFTYPPAFLHRIPLLSLSQLVACLLGSSLPWYNSMLSLCAMFGFRLKSCSANTILPSCTLVFATPCQTIYRRSLLCSMYPYCFPCSFTSPIPTQLFFFHITINALRLFSKVLGRISVEIDPPRYGPLALISDHFREKNYLTLMVDNAT